MTQRLRELGISGAFIAVATLFFAWGFLSSNNDPLIVAMRAAFGLNYTQALQIQLVSFLANGLMALPAASLGNRLGPVNTILLALATMVAGCLSVGKGLDLHSYGAVLVALFVMGSGITMLQVAANPLAAALGPEPTSHFRLNFAQAFNSLGVVIGVNFGATVMLGQKVMAAGQGHLHGEADRIALFGAVKLAFLTMAGMLLVLGLFIWLQRERLRAGLSHGAAGSSSSVLEALRSRWALFGALAIGLYVGAEVSIGSIMINFLNKPAIMGLPLELGGVYLANFYWGGALAGRLFGSYLLTRVPASRLLALCATMATGLCLVALTGAGALSGWAALSVGLFNSIMFPVIFTLTLERSGASRSSTSGLLCLAIVSGALLPWMVGKVADDLSLAIAFAIPAGAYALILLFALRVAREERREAV